MLCGAVGDDHGKMKPETSVIERSVALRFDFQRGDRFDSAVKLIGDDASQGLAF